MNLDLSTAHCDYQELIPPLLDELLGRYSRAKLSSLRVGLPRRDGDTSMGYYDEDTQEIRLNAHWFARPVSVLRRAATSAPLFHGPMTDEPRHVLTHEVFHSLDRVDPLTRSRMREAWLAATRKPRLMPADYGLSNATEFFAELGALVEMNLATVEQRQMLSWIMNI